MSKDVSVKDLINSFSLGSEASFKKVFEKFYPQVLVFVRSYLDYEDAKDVTANTFVKVWEKRNDFVSTENIRAFLFVAAKNACINFLKREKYVQTRQDLLPRLSQQDLSHDFELSQLKADLYERVSIELEKLPEKSRNIFKLAFLDGLDNYQIANLLGLDVQTVKNQKVNALKRLRLAIGKRPLYILILIFLEK